MNVNDTYYFNPYHFDSSEYTDQELVTILRDICTGVCRPDVTTNHILPFEGDGLRTKAMRNYFINKKAKV